MIAKIGRGDRMGGLMVYLAGPGRENEHTDQHLVAGDSLMMGWHGTDTLSRDEALAIAKHLDRPRTAFDVDVQGGHVWHASLSLSREEGELSDEQWNQIAHQFVTGMGFDDQDGTRAPCRWVAVRHGVSKAGNDHVHIAVNLVRDDGTKASTHNDYKRASSVRQAIEVEHGLQQVAGRESGRAYRAYNAADERVVKPQAERIARQRYDRARGETDPAWESLAKQDRNALTARQVTRLTAKSDVERRLRSASTGSNSEADFVRRARRGGLMVRPRFADGRDDVVTGYSVAQRGGERPIWFGGGTVAPDLTLARLRSGMDWPDSPEDASKAIGEWTAAKTGARITDGGADDLSTAERSERFDALNKVRDRLANVDPSDHETWTHVARQTSGALSAWSAATEPEPGELAEAADALARSARTHQRPNKPVPKDVRGALAGVATLAMSAGRGGTGKTSELILIQQFARLALGVYKAEQAAGDRRHAERLLAEVREPLVRVQRRMNEGLPAAESGTATAVAERPALPLDPDVQDALDTIRKTDTRPSGPGAVPEPGRQENETTKAASNEQRER